ncbi:hypothetical protein B0H11DRAFT_1114111 [Mycena galericulata]|nr:hypothetical protein B0H11DRAFT_1114111 [Mycena galericulata]
MSVACKKRTGARKRATTPTPAEWAGMIPYGAFVVTDAEGNDHIFKLGDNAAVLPAGTKVGTLLPSHEYWIARILAIRERNTGHFPSKKRKRKSEQTKVTTIVVLLLFSVVDKEPQSPDIWVQIRWFYSPKEVPRIPGFNESHCSRFERIYSDHSEIISALTFDALTQVIRFREDDPDQVPIGDEEFFTRYFLQTSSFPGEISSYVLRTSTHLAESMGCICGGPYNLNDKSPLHIMHMCPRPHCRKSYHSSCLLEHGYWTILTHPLIRLACSPDTDHTPAFSPGNHEHPIRPRSVDASCTARSTPPPRLPDDLLTLAAQPIVRGAALPALGLTGNCRAVVLARRIVYAALQPENATPVPRAWKESVINLDLDAAIVHRHLPALKREETGEDLVFVCPNCYGPI